MNYIYIYTYIFQMKYHMSTEKRDCEIIDAFLKLFCEHIPLFSQLEIFNQKE